MNAKKFSDAMSELDSKYIDEALNYKKKAQKPIWAKWGDVAACLGLVIVSTFTINRLIGNDSVSQIELASPAADAPHWYEEVYEL